MWGYSSNYPSINNYAEAERVYNNTAPLRGRPDFRPLDSRSSRAKSQIIKQGDDYTIRLYSTDIVTYKPDGSVFVTTGGWSTSSTRAAISIMSPLSAWSSQGYTAVAVRVGRYVPVEAKRFILPRSGLLFTPDAEGQLMPVNPPTAVQRKKRVKREEAKAVRKYFKQVPVYIEAFSKAFAGGHKPLVTAHSLVCNVSQLLDEETASNIAWVFVCEEWNYVTGKRAIVNQPKEAVAAFWRAVYDARGLVEEYEVSLPYGVVA